MKKLMLIFIPLLTLSCHKFPESPLESDEDLKHTPGIVRIEADRDFNLILYLDYSYSSNSTLIVERKAKGGFERVGYLRLSQTTLVDTSFNKEFDNTFIYRVRVEKGDLRSDYSAEKSYEYISSILNMPQSLRINVLELQGNEISWIDRSDREEGYKVEKNDGSGWQELASLPANTQKYMHSISGIPTLPMSLSYRVKAFNSALSSPWAEIATNYTGIGIPSNLRITDNKSYHFAIDWADNSNIETGYLVERKKDDGLFTEVAHLNANITQYNDKIAEVGSYSYRVRARKNDLCSLYSNEASSFVQTIIPIEGLIAYYPFTGNANDETENNKNGTIHGPILSTDRLGYTGSSYKFNGNTDYIALPVLWTASPSEITFSLWCKAAELSASECKLLYHGLNGEIFIRLNSNKFGFFAKLADCNWYGVNSTKATTSNEWYHIVGVWKKNQDVQLFINGVRDASISVPDLLLFNPGNGWLPAIGAYLINNSPVEFFNGYIDDIRIYNRALTGSEINSLYHEGGWGY